VNNIAIAPSMMCADFINLKHDLDVFAQYGIRYLHIDIMDGHYVPNVTLGPDFCKSLAGYSHIPLDVHLMIEPVDAFIPRFAVFRNTLITFHPEAVYHPLRSIQLIRDKAAVPGIAIDPATPLEAVRYLLPHVDVLCIMTVNPGYSGQALIPGMIDKIREAAEWIREHNLSVKIEVDGNVSWENIPPMVQAGADILVAGTSSLFDGKADLASNIDTMNALLRDISVQHHA